MSRRAWTLGPEGTGLCIGRELAHFLARQIILCLTGIMNLLLKRKDPEPSLTYMISIAAFVLSAVVFTVYLHLHYHKLIYVMMAAVGSCCFLYFLTLSWPEPRPVVAFNDEGILDHRLGVGTIRWEDIVNAQIEMNGPFLCLRVKNPDFYIERLGPVRRKNMQFHQSLGFRMLNIELRGLDVHPLSLLDLVRKRIGQTSL